MASYKQCVENHCKDCVYDPTEPGSWRKQVSECGIIDCALWEVRPRTMAEIEKNRKKKKR